MSPIFFFYVPSVQPQPGVPLLTKLRQMDWLGVILNAGIYVGWVVVLQFGGSTWAWSDGRTIATFVVTGVLIVLFGFTQYYSVFTTPERRLFPIEFLKRRTVLLMYLLMSCVMAGIFITIFYVPFYFEFAHGDSGVDSAVRLLPFVFLLVIFNLVNSWGMARFGYYMPWYLFAGLTVTAGGGKPLYSYIASAPQIQLQKMTVCWLFKGHCR